MRNWRVLTAGVAVIFMVLAAIGSYYYLNKADERAQSKQQLVTVLVATQSIPKGTTGLDALNRGLVALAKRTRGDAPAASLTGTDTIKTLVAAAAIDKDSIITASAFVTAAALGGSLSNSIDHAKPQEWKQAIAVTVDLPHGVAGLIIPNDTVNLMTTAKIRDVTNKGDLATASVTAFVLKGLKVLAVGATTAAPVTPVATTGPDGKPTTTAAPAPSQANVGLLTLEVTPRQAEQIAHNQAAGWPLYLTLNPAGFNSKDVELPIEIVEAVNFFDQDLKTLIAYEKSVPKS